MNKKEEQKKNDVLIKTINKKYGVKLNYKSDSHLHNALIKEGLPSLSKLLKMTQGKSK